MRNVNVGLVGCGRISQVGHLPAIKANPEARLSGVCDIDEKAAKRAGEYNKVFYTTNHVDLLERDDIEAVIVAVPHKYHKEITVDACKHKKHVLCEKPLAINLEEADDMIKAAEKNKVILMTAENYLYDPAVQKILEFVRNGDLGKIELVHLSQVGFYPTGGLELGWRRIKDIAGGGLLIDDGVHLTSLALFFAGAVDSLFAKIDTYHPVQQGRRIDVEDNAFVAMEHKSGALSTINVSGINRFPHFRFEVHGDEGSALFQWMIGTPFTQYKPEIKIAGFKQELPQLPYMWFPSPNSYSNELKHFVDCVANEKKPFTDGRVGREALKLVLDAYESASRKERLIIQQEFNL